MKWMQFERFRKDFHQVIHENEENHPLYGFLSFLINYKGVPQIEVTVIGDWRKTKVQKINIQFGSEATQTCEMGELPIFDYQWFLKSPKMLLEHFAKDAQLESARYQYDKIQKIVQHYRDSLETYRNRGRDGLYRVMEIRAYENMEGFGERLETAIEDGALFNGRLDKLYQQYLAVSNKPQEAPAPAPELSPPVHDLIEVELLTILEDPDISALTKSDAQETLEVYRQEKVTVERNPKEDNARIAIQTIRKYYTKNDREAVGEGG